MKNLTILLSLMLITSMGFSVAYGHTTVEVKPYEIEVGWGTEPPVVGFRNTFVFDITKPGEVEGIKTGVKNAFRDLEAVVKFGGVTKTLDINSDPRPGHYFANVIPTKTGSMSVDIKGEISDVPIDINVPIEDVESTAVLDFPPTSGSSDQDVIALKNAISALQQEVRDLMNGGTNSNLNVGPAYDLAVLGLSLGAAGVILAIVAMIKRK